MARVLLIRLSSLGDVVLATSAVEALHRDRPELTVDVLTKPAFTSLFESNPHVDRVIPWREGVSPAVMARELKPSDYQLVADLHGNLRTRLLRLFLRGKWSVYPKGVLRRRLAVLLRSTSPLKRALHVTERYTQALGPLGVRGAAAPKLHLTQAETEKASLLLKDSGWDGIAPVVALAPAAAWATKAWPAAKWKELACACREKLGAFPLLIGGGQDRDLCESVLGGGVGANLAGSADLIETGALLSKAACLVSNDSAPLHLAGAVGTPVAALFGPTVPAYGFYPAGPRDKIIERKEVCRPCALHGHKKCPLGHHNCLARVASEEVFKAVAALVEGR